MKAIWGSAAALAVTLVVVTWVRRIKRIHAEGKSPMSPKWLVENTYDKNGDRR